MDVLTCKILCVYVSVHVCVCVRYIYEMSGQRKKSKVTIQNHECAILCIFALQLICYGELKQTQWLRALLQQAKNRRLLITPKPLSPEGQEGAQFMCVVFSIPLYSPLFPM